MFFIYQFPIINLSGNNMRRISAVFIVFSLLGLSLFISVLPCMGDRGTQAPGDKLVIDQQDLSLGTSGAGPKNITAVAWVEAPFLQQFEAKGKDVLQWTFDTNCPWLRWDDVDHVASGVPTMLDMGSCNVRVGVSDKPNDTKVVNLTINISGPKGTGMDARILSPVDGRTYSYSEAANLTFEGAVKYQLPGLDYSWFDNGQLLVNGSLDIVSLSPGTHVIELKVSDGNESSTAKATIQVLGPAPMKIGPTVPKLSGLALLASVLAPSLLLTVLAFGMTETGRYGLLAPFAPMYSKIRKDSLLDNFTRGKIFQYILDHPGVHLGAVQRSLDLNNGLAIYHLRKLEQEGYVVSKRMGIQRRFYPSDMNVPSVPSNQERILDTIRSNPGITQTEIGQELELSLSTVNDYINRLRMAKLIKVIKKGKRTLCFIFPENQEF